MPSAASAKIWQPTAENTHHVAADPRASDSAWRARHRGVAEGAAAGRRTSSAAGRAVRRTDRNRGPGLGHPAAAALVVQARHGVLFRRDTGRAADGARRHRAVLDPRAAVAALD